MNSVIFKIENFSQKKKNTIIESETFQINGYNMCIRVYPEGDGVGRHTHLSVFFCIGKGENDDSLSWPFGGIMKMSLLNAEGEVIIWDKIKPDIRSACYMKPCNDFNIGSGFPKFIHLSKLETVLKAEDSVTIKCQLMERFPPINDYETQEQQVVKEKPGDHSKKVYNLC